MTVVQSAYTPFAYVELAHPGASAIFRALAFASAKRIMMNQMQRRERLVYMLLDGRRTVTEVARLLHLSEVQVAHIMVYLLKFGYIEYVRG
ncbi:MAG: hypothetical protein ACRDIV_09195 [Ktedonobacteraceae bacterium]